MEILVGILFVALIVFYILDGKKNKRYRAEFYKKHFDRDFSKAEVNQAELYRKAIDCIEFEAYKAENDYIEKSKKGGSKNV